MNRRRVAVATAGVIATAVVATGAGLAVRGSQGGTTKQSRPVATPSTAPVPLPDSCHASGTTAATNLPDPRCTPGAIDPRVAQANVQQTICKKGYTKSVRPPTSYTTPLKLRLMAAYGYKTRNPGEFELDHLISLELGGAPSDPGNLWPESGPSPNPKDTVEGRLHTEVCHGHLSLAAAQREIATNWTTAT